MAKFQVFSLLLFCFLLLALKAEMTNVKATTNDCERYSQQFRGICLGREAECEDVCTRLEHTLRGECQWDWGGSACFCYVC
ncbi:hypothetical protein K7X08_021699 [Anisodus acutangulus]|uniref:Knottins-like domain-containing protein n=1 Tax=Anisodus acutangulus TaxID=402998 RepID=A0A9Q1M703_9SOLA|nr:hypothetical protein K7X08_021699 [Anisodus acutangulus]